jgi:hypothetical protein
MRSPLLAVSLFVLMSGPVLAQDKALPDPGPPPEVEPSELPPKVLDSDARIEPMVTITTDESGQITEEYSQNGTVYMVKVTPKNGVTYYLFDNDGDGSLETRWTETQGLIKPVYYKIKEWK